MKLLSIDASGKSAAVCLSKGEDILAESFVNNGFTHSETLLPLVAETLKKGKMDILEVEGYAITVGPGSFTGLRIGAAMVKGLAGDCPCYPVPTLLALAETVMEDGIILPMMDARRNQTYTAAFRREKGVLARLAQDEAVAVSVVEERIAAYLQKGEKVFVPGDGGYLLGARRDVVFPENPLITGEAVWRAAKGITPVSAAELRLEYLRLSQAEREKLEKNKGGNEK